MAVLFPYPIFTYQKYDSVNIEGLDGGTLFYEHINSDSTVEGLAYQEVFTIRASRTARRSIPIRQFFVRLTT